MKFNSEKTIERVSLYRRQLFRVMSQGIKSIYSHELAERIGATAAQVRRDLMEIGFKGSSKKGYEVEGLIKFISDFLDNPECEKVVLVGVGNLGRALLSFFTARRPNLKIVAAFDQDPMKNGRVIHGCRCYGIDELEQVVAETQSKVAILAVPSKEAQGVAERLLKAGVKGIVNFAPVYLQLPVKVSVENIDVTMALEKVSFLARQKTV
ncbi:MAG: hypothetical protein ACD_79C01497G0003 [uncultured bacterium]|nr:MAG: hypothetical protein ACD_79C01497G0003 [uncultured bacterium]